MLTTRGKLYGGPNQSHFSFLLAFLKLLHLVCAYLHVWHHVHIVYSLYPSSLYEPFSFCHWNMPFRCLYWDTMSHNFWACSHEGVHFFPFKNGGGRGRWGGACILVFPLVPNVFPWGSPKFLSCPHKIFPIAPQLYRILFAQSSTPMYVNWKDRP